MRALRKGQAQAFALQSALLPTGGMDSLLSLRGSESSGGEIGYGVAVFGGGFTGMPNVGLGLSEGARDYRLDWRLTSAVRGDSGFEVNRDVTRGVGRRRCGASH